MLLVALQMIEWGLRYYFLGAVLVFLAVMAGAALIGTKDEAKPFKTVRVVLKAVGIALLMLLATLPASLFPEYEMVETTGEYQVATVSYTYTDASRLETYTNTGDKRKLNVRLWYPGTSDGHIPSA